MTMDKEETRAALDAAVAETAELLSDGLDIEDIAKLVRLGVEVAEQYTDLTGVEKRTLAEAFAVELIEEHLTEATPKLRELIAELDLPGPAWLEESAWDPLLAAVLPRLLGLIVRAALPSLFDLVVSASRGEIAINLKEENTDE